MCGIAGIVDTSGVSAEKLEEVSRVLRHRGPDDEGYLLVRRDGHTVECSGSDTVGRNATLPRLRDAASGGQAIVGFVHRRLSILDLSDAGHQPMQNTTGELYLSYNGEVYNYRELRKELESIGYSFHSGSDTEVILNAYDAWGEECVSRFVGMWAFSIYDGRKRRVFLSRDRFGVKPLYYSAGREHFMFASEVKALLALGVKPAADMDQVLTYLFYGSTGHDGSTLYSDVHELGAGCNLSLDIDTLDFRTETYYRLSVPEGGRREVSIEEAAQEYRDRLTASVRLHLRSDVPVGSCLSGGLDSTSIVGAAAPMMNGSAFRTFTAAYEDPQIDESGYVREVAMRFGNIEPHFTYPSLATYWEDIDRLIWHQDFPIHSTSMFAQWEVMKLASSNGMKVLLDGQGADEVIGGYANFAGVYLLELLLQGRVAAVIRDAHLLSRNRSISAIKEMSRAAFYRLPATLQPLVRKRARTSASLITAGYRTRLPELEPPPMEGRDYAAWSISNVGSGLQNLLRYEDRNSMAFSIEARVPFLDHRFVEFVIGLPTAVKMRSGWSKYVQRVAVEALLPASVVWRHDKMGFVTPQNQWRKETQDALKDFLETYRPPDFVDRQRLEEISSGAAAQPPSANSEFWRTIAFLKWSQVFGVTF